MPRVTYIEAMGERHEIELQAGESVMQAAVARGLKGIEGECGGVLACGTCHVYVDESWTQRLPPPQEAEQVMLEFAANVATNSRLGCQLKCSETIDGLIVRLPLSQR
jgi:ferredoxin, 2Fe-2S